MMDKIITFITNHHLNDLSSVLGVIITIIGFFVTILNVLRSKSAAEKAEQAVREVRKDFLKINTIAELSAAITAMDEIMRLHRQQEVVWATLLDRYTTLKKSLIAVKGSNYELSNSHKQVIQSTIQNIRDLYVNVDKAIKSNKKPDIKVPNKILLNKADALQEILIEMRNKIGG